jgi:YfiH family protein
VHAGWRGLVAGVIEAAVTEMKTPGTRLMAWLGPAIGPDAFEVGDDVRDAFTRDDAGAASAFRSRGEGKWVADLYQLARLRLQRLGIEHVSGGTWCTYTDAQRFYSYRRDGVTGRMATLIWIA